MSQGNFMRTIAGHSNPHALQVGTIIRAAANPISVGYAGAYMTIRLMLHMRSARSQQSSQQSQPPSASSHGEGKGPNCVIRRG